MEITEAVAKEHLHIVQAGKKLELCLCHLKGTALEARL